MTDGARGEVVPGVRGCVSAGSVFVLDRVEDDFVGEESVVVGVFDDEGLELCGGGGQDGATFDDGVLDGVGVFGEQFVEGFLLGHFDADARGDGFDFQEGVGGDHEDGVIGPVGLVGVFDVADGLVGQEVEEYAAVNGGQAGEEGAPVAVSVDDGQGVGLFVFVGALESPSVVRAVRVGGPAAEEFFFEEQVVGGEEGVDRGDGQTAAQQCGDCVEEYLSGVHGTGSLCVVLIFVRLGLLWCGSGGLSIASGRQKD